MDAKEAISKLIAEGNNKENPKETRETCMQVADFLEQQVVNLSLFNPTYKRVPWSALYIAVCPKCNAELETDATFCKECGRKIIWK